MYQFDTSQKHEYSILFNIWESSVKATHHFVKEGDIQILKKIIQEKEIFNLVNLICIRDSDNLIVGFMGVSEDSLEMLFINSNAMRQGIGKMLLLHAINDLGITRVDVNEQNEQAIGFYEHFGFRANSRSEVDGQGKPYPIYPCLSFTQNNIIDSLEKVLQTQKEDSNKALTLNRLSENLIMEREAKKSMEYANTSIILSEKIN